MLIKNKNYEKSMRKLWDGKCTVYERQKTVDPISKITKYTEIPIITNQNCRISFLNISSTSDDNYPIIQQSVKLLISNLIIVIEGSKIEVTQNGITTLYKRSGVSAFYTKHQEIPIELFQRWA